MVQNNFITTARLHKQARMLTACKITTIIWENSKRSVKSGKNTRNDFSAKKLPLITYKLYVFLILERNYH